MTKPIAAVRGIQRLLAGALTRCLRRASQVAGVDAEDAKTARDLIWRAAVVVGASATLGFSVRVFLWTSGFGGQ